LIRFGALHKGFSMLTLRQIEVVRAVMVTGTLARAARLLNVTAPGISRLVKHTEESLGIRLFDKRGGRLVPSERGRNIFDQINVVFSKIEDLRYIIDNVKSGVSQELRIGSAPSISQVMIPRAIERVRARFPQLLIDVNMLKIEETVDYLLLGKGEVVAMSSRFDHPGLTCEPLASGRFFCIVPEVHPLCARSTVSASEIVQYPLIGIDDSDPYGRMVSEIFSQRGLDYQLTVRARFAMTVCSLVKAGLGIAVIDQFTVADKAFPGIRLIEIEGRPSLQTWIITKSDSSQSAFATAFVEVLRQVMAIQVLPG
jgi:DNA-binding transcriptional LysR family regulator